jgi:hypothetical protein
MSAYVVFTRLIPRTRAHLDLLRLDTLFPTENLIFR